MKKIIFALVAVAALASCSNEDVIELNRTAIAFGDNFIENSTRADYSNGKLLDSFKVYGTANDVLIFDGDAVTRPTSLSSGGYDNTKAWNCDETQYWVPGATYNFAAIVDGGLSPVTAMPTTINHTVVTGDEDLLYAEATASVDGAGTVTGLTNDMVAFTFNHLLSKLYFTVSSTMTDYTVTPISITVTGVQKKGTYTVDGTYDGVDNGTWAKDGVETTSLEFVDGGLQSRQIIPVEQELTVTIVYDTYFGGAKISRATKTATIPARTYAAKTVYGITANIDGNAIQFTVNTFADFTAGSDINITM